MMETMLPITLTIAPTPYLGHWLGQMDVKSHHPIPIMME